MLLSRTMTPPAGTFLGKARDGAIQFPRPLREFCEASGWTLFRVTPVDDSRLEMRPVMPEDTELEFHSSLSAEGVLWIPAATRSAVALGEHSVMLRVEGGSIQVYLRKVFETLGFRP